MKEGQGIPPLQAPHSPPHSAPILMSLRAGALTTSQHCGVHFAYVNSCEVGAHHPHFTDR